MPGLWDEMLDEFRALGGTADNVCLRDGPFGRGLFPLDPSRPVNIRIPDSLLVQLKHVEFDNNVFQVGPGARIGAREKNFLENYQRDFSWGAGRQFTEDLLQMIPELRELLNLPFNADRWLAEPTPRLTQELFLASRVINYKESWTIMPIVELANHGHATHYTVNDGVGLSGQFSDEILPEYQLCDPLKIFTKWGFASGCESFALSLSMGLEGKSGSIVIERDDVSVAPGRRPFFPDVSIRGREMTLSYLMLGHKNHPRLARGNFYRIMRDAGRSDAEETFDRIQHINRTQLYRLASASERAAPALGRLLRDVARFQLEAMSHSIGTCEV
jgi:hypothetical protein